MNLRKFFQVIAIVAISVVSISSTSTSASAKHLQNQHHSSTPITNNLKVKVSDKYNKNELVTDKKHSDNIRDVIVDVDIDEEPKFDNSSTEDEQTIEAPDEETDNSANQEEVTDNEQINNDQSEEVTDDNEIINDENPSLENDYPNIPKDETDDSSNPSDIENHNSSKTPDSKDKPSLIVDTDSDSNKLEEIKYDPSQKLKPVKPIKVSPSHKTQLSPYDFDKVTDKAESIYKILDPNGFKKYLEYKSKHDALLAPLSTLGEYPAGISVEGQNEKIDELSTNYQPQIDKFYELCDRSAKLLNMAR
jgi:hypothetical protein